MGLSLLFSSRIGGAGLLLVGNGQNISAAVAGGPSAFDDKAFPVVRTESFMLPNRTMTIFTGASIEGPALLVEPPEFELTGFGHFSSNLSKYEG